MVFSLTFIALALGGIGYTGNYNFFPATSILEFLYFVIFGFLVLRLLPKISVVSGALIAYYLYNLFAAIVFSGAGTFDFLQSSKFLLYSIIFSFALEVRRGYFDIKKIRRFFLYLCAAFSVKYVVIVGMGVSARPGLLTENNFELFGLGVFAILLWFHSGSARYYELAILLFLTMLSGSRSAAFGMLPVIAAFNLIVFKNSSGFRSIFLPIGLMVASAVAFYIVSERIQYGDSIYDIDRLHFFNLFTFELDTWGIKEYVFGTFPITPLSNYTCSSLSFYEHLFSFSDETVCYSVILHSMILRTVYDHGLFGLFISFLLIYYFSVRCGLSRKAGTLILLLCIINSISVSAYNSVYFWLPFILFLYTKNQSTPRALNGQPSTSRK